MTDPQERPILFSAPMVRAILSGTKTQTRRIVKPEPAWETQYCCTYHHPDEDKHGPHWWSGADTGLIGLIGPCPYGQPGDRLWLREAWRTERHFDHLPPRDLDPTMKATPVQYEVGQHADVLDGKLRHGMFMPRWASRITLEITGVRVERLQDISEADAIAEGVVEHPTLKGRACNVDGGPMMACGPVPAYRALWESINGPGSWDANPWVWVVQLVRVEAEQ